MDGNTLAPLAIDTVLSKALSSRLMNLKLVVIKLFVCVNNPGQRRMPLSARRLGLKFAMTQTSACVCESQRTYIYAYIHMYKLGIPCMHATNIGTSCTHEGA